MRIPSRKLRDRELRQAIATSQARRFEFGLTEQRLYGPDMATCEAHYAEGFHLTTDANGKDHVRLTQVRLRKDHARLLPNEPVFDNSLGHNTCDQPSTRAKYYRDLPANVEPAPITPGLAACLAVLDKFNKSR